MELKVKPFISQKIKEIRKEVGNKRTLVATSGGVDSMTWVAGQLSFLLMTG